MATVNYIIAAYLGPRRMEFTPSGEGLLREHLDRLAEYETPEIARVSIVVNARSEEDVLSAIKIKEEYMDRLPEIKVSYRHNFGHSYGAWNDEITSCLEKNEHFDYFMLVEDDVKPGRPDYLKLFMDRADHGMGYVCCKVTHGHGVGIHAGMSSGIILNSVAKSLWKQFGSAFIVRPSISYWEAEHNQLHFLDLVKAEGLRIVDISDLASMPFFEQFHGIANVVEHGNPDEPPALVPILLNDAILYTNLGEVR